VLPRLQSSTTPQSFMKNRLAGALGKSQAAHSPHRPRCPLLEHHPAQAAHRGTPSGVHRPSEKSVVPLRQTNGVLLTTSTTHDPATDLGYLLHKHPDRVQEFTQSFGVATVFYHEATAERCTVALLLGGDLIIMTRHRFVDLSSERERAAAVDWWLELTAAGGEGAVVKPARLADGMVQPGLKAGTRRCGRYTSRSSPYSPWSPSPSTRAFMCRSLSTGPGPAGAGGRGRSWACPPTGAG